MYAQHGMLIFLVTWSISVVVSEVLDEDWFSFFPMANETIQ